MTKEIKWLLNEKYQGVESEAFHADCKRLEAGEPLAYLIGHMPFLDCTIHLDSHPLIPRPETEYWTEKALLAIKQSNIGKTYVNPWDDIPKILDLCAGSGAIGVTVAKAIPEAKVTFAELDTNHLSTINKNLSQNTIIYDSEKYKILKSDLFANLLDENFDFILTNPPYIDAEAHTVDESVTLHEPHLALFGGVAGLEIIARIITTAPQFLTAIGQLWIEHEPIQSETVCSLALSAGFYSAITHPDQYGVPRFSVLTMAQ